MSSENVSVEQAYAIALAHHQAGRLAHAEHIYRQILALHPDQPDTLHLLGLIEHQNGRHAQAAVLIARSLSVNENNPAAYSNFAEVHKALGQWEEARVCCERSLALDPNSANAHNNLGTIYLRFDRLPEARQCLERAIALDPDRPEGHHNLGLVLARLQMHQPAREQFERAVTLRPDYAEGHGCLGCVLTTLGEFAPAHDHLRRALELKPDYADAYGYLAALLSETVRFGEGKAVAERALQFDPENPSASGSLAFCLQELGQLEAALTAYRRVVEKQPTEIIVHSNLIHSLHFHPATTSEDVRRESERFNERHVAPLRALRQPPTNVPDPVRQLKVGYVSPDFRDHAISHFMLPLLRARDRAHYETHAYASGPRTDEMTDRLRAETDRWRDVSALSDEALAAQIRADGIDILVDLSLHTAHHRLLVFARRPSPVQVSWLGYAGTSGVEGIDYRFTDAYIDPPDLGPKVEWSSEEPIRLPDSWCCYEPSANAPDVGPLPANAASANGLVTFGSLNQMGKQHEGTLRLWARVLAATPNSRLLIYNPDPESQAWARGIFEVAGVSGKRLDFVGRMHKSDCLRVYRDRFDLALDPFPHCGMTTTCEALWMGVPVVSLVGASPVARTGLSLLKTVGLPELAAPDEASYVRVASELAGDLPRLAALRASLRERMKASPLLDGPRFTRNIEGAYRAMWQRWCERQQRS